MTTPAYPSVTDELIAELERLCVENDDASADDSAWVDGFTIGDFKALLSERAELKAENEALREDHDKAWRLAGMNLENLGSALAENDRLRKQIEDMSPFNGSPLTGPDLKCLACGGYHYGMSGLPCPKMAPTAGSSMTP